MNRNIPFIDPFLGKSEKEAISKVMDSKFLVEGKFTKEFENKFKKFIGVKHAIACSSGTSALHLIFEALGLNPGDEVITTPFTFIATPNSILYGGLIPKFTDIDSKTWNLDPNKVRELIGKKTKAIMPVHIFGLPANMPELREIAEEKELMLVEDAAQAFGGKIKNKQSGSFGDVASFSLYATKNLISGEGGVVTTNSDEIAEKVESLKNHGRAIEGGYRHLSIGYNYRMTDLTGAVASKQMDKASKILNLRAENAKHYRKVIDQISTLKYQIEPDGYKHGNYIFAIDTRNCKIKPEEAIKKLKEQKISARKIYHTLAYEQECYKNIESWKWAKYLNFPDYRKNSCPIAESVAKNHLKFQ